MRKPWTSQEQTPSPAFVGRPIAASGCGSRRHEGKQARKLFLWETGKDAHYGCIKGNFLHPSRHGKADGVQTKSCNTGGVRHPFRAVLTNLNRELLFSSFPRPQNDCSSSFSLPLPPSLIFCIHSISHRYPPTLPLTEKQTNKQTKHSFGAAWASAQPSLPEKGKAAFRREKNCNVASTRVVYVREPRAKLLALPIV